MTEPDARFWAVEHVASYYGVSRRAIYHAISKGALPAFYVGGALRVKREDALSFGRPVNVVPPVTTSTVFRVVPSNPD
jgi:excisionase family DNA binding protein